MKQTTVAVTVNLYDDTVTDEAVCKAIDAAIDNINDYDDQALLGWDSYRVAQEQQSVVLQELILAVQDTMAMALNDERSLTPISRKLKEAQLKAIQHLREQQ